MLVRIQAAQQAQTANPATTRTTERPERPERPEQIHDPKPDGHDKEQNDGVQDYILLPSQLISMRLVPLGPVDHQTGAPSES